MVGDIQTTGGNNDSTVERAAATPREDVTRYRPLETETANERIYADRRHERESAVGNIRRDEVMPPCGGSR